MDVSISTAIIATIGVSFYQIFQNTTHVYFDSAMTLCFFLLIGRYLDFKTRKKAFDVGLEFSLLSANFARIVNDDGSLKIIAAKNIKKGMVLLIQAGEKIAADGEVISGESEIDNAVITGETKPLIVKKGSQVFACAININNPIEVKVGKNHQESLLKQIQDIIEESENHKNKFVKIADKIAGYYTPAVHVVASLTFVIWYFLIGASGQDATLNAIAPNTSSSEIVGQWSQSIEPLYSNFYISAKAKNKRTVKNRCLVELLMEKEKNTMEVWTKKEQSMS